MRESIGGVVNVPFFIFALLIDTTLTELGFKKEIRAIVSEVRRLHFPEARFVYVVFLNMKNSYMAILPPILGTTILFVDKKVKSFDRSAWEALIVHELAHFRTGDERQADLEVIQLGYGPGLVSFHQQHNKKYRKYKKKDGLTLKEIKALL